jgi:hypothetical protein
MSKTQTSRAAWRAIRAFDKIEARFVKASGAYLKACRGSNLDWLNSTFSKLRLAERDMRATYAAMGRAWAADTIQHFAVTRGRMLRNSGDDHARA